MHLGVKSPSSPQTVATALLIAAPWINPFAPGPAPAVVPWLVALAAAAGVVLLWSKVTSTDGAGLVFARFHWRAFALAWGWLAAGLLSSLIGLLQYFDAAEMLRPLVNVSRLGEAFGNLRQRNQFATLTNIALVALFWLSRRQLNAPGRLWPTGLGICLLMFGNAASSSRTGLVQLGLLCMLLWLWGGLRLHRDRALVLLAVVSYFAASFLLPWLAGFEFFGHGLAARLRAGDEICASRLTLWSNVLYLIAEKPWLGWGWGELDYAHYITLYPANRFCDILDNAHNLPLHIAVELGVPAALVACAAVTWILLWAKPWHESEPARQMAWAVLGMILLHSMLEYPLWYGPFQMAVGLCLVLLCGPSCAERLGPGRAAPAMAWACAVAAFSVLLAGAYAAHDYFRVSQIYLPVAARHPAYREGTLNKVRDTLIFRDQVRFADLTTTALSPDNAPWVHDAALKLLHFSPEPRVIEKVIESAVMLGRDEEALLHLIRFRAAFPDDYEKWRPAPGSAVLLGR